MTVDQEKIDALLDGALEHQDALELEAKIASDRSALQALGESTLLNITLKRVLDPNSDDADLGMPQTDNYPTLQSANDNTPFWRMSFPTIAASLMVISAGVAGFFGGQLNDPVPARLEAALGSIELAKTETFAKALEQLKSGEMANWQDTQTGWSGVITPLRTYKAKNDRWCREYRTIDQLGKTTSVRLGVACRNSEGMWQTELERMGES